MFHLDPIFAKKAIAIVYDKNIRISYNTPSSTILLEYFAMNVHIGTHADMSDNANHILDPPMFNFDVTYATHVAYVITVGMNMK